jgi:hypothetical protein
MQSVYSFFARHKKTSYLTSMTGLFTAVGGGAAAGAQMGIGEAFAGAAAGFAAWAVPYVWIKPISSDCCVEGGGKADRRENWRNRQLTHQAGLLDRKANRIASTNPADPKVAVLHGEATLRRAQRGKGRMTTLKGDPAYTPIAIPA